MNIDAGRIAAFPGPAPHGKNIVVRIEPNAPVRGTSAIGDSAPAGPYAAVTMAAVRNAVVAGTPAIFVGNRTRKDVT